MLTRSAATAVLLLFLGMYSQAAHAIDCTRAATEREKTVCGVPSLLAFDTALSTAYRGARGLEANPKEGDKGRNLRREQRQWIRTVDACGADPVCIRQSYASRYAALRAYSDAKFSGLENVADLADVLEPWVTADPATRGVPIAMRSEAGDAHVLAVPISWGKPFPYYEVHFIKSGERPQRINFPDVSIPSEMVGEVHSGNFTIADVIITSGAVFQNVSFVGRNIVSKAMTGSAGSEWTYRRWSLDWTGANGPSPSLMKYEIQNARDGSTVTVVDISD